MTGAGMRRNPIRVVFVGDSITASTRDMNKDDDLGGGYPKYVAEILERRYGKENFFFRNRGIWGNETKDLLSRLKTDVLDFGPDIIVLFIGVNDTLRHAEAGDLPMDVFQSQYARIIDMIKEQTTAKILVIEPYLLMEDFYNRAKKRFDLIARIDVIRRTVKGRVDGYLPLDGLFASLYVTDDAEGRTADGLHPNARGAQFIGEHCAAYLLPIVESLFE